MIRLKELRLEKGMNMRQTAIALNIPYTTYISYEKAEREPNSETLIMLADYFNCSIDYLIGRTDERIDDNLLDRALEVDNDLLEKYGNIYEAKNAQEARDNSQTLPDLINNTLPAVESNATILPDSNVRMIPVYESVSAGFGAHAENMIVDYMPLYIVSAAEAENTLIIRVEGDSMYPKIEDGDSIQVLRQDFAENGQVAVLLIDNEDAVVKQFFHDPDAKTVTLHSFNPDYKDRVFEGIEITKLRILGVVRRVIKDI